MHCLSCRARRAGRGSSEEAAARGRRDARVVWRASPDGDSHRGLVIGCASGEEPPGRSNLGTALSKVMPVPLHECASARCGSCDTSDSIRSARVPGVPGKGLRAHPAGACLCPLRVPRPLPIDLALGRRSSPWGGGDPPGRGRPRLLESGARRPGQLFANLSPGAKAGPSDVRGWHMVGTPRDRGSDFGRPACSLGIRLQRLSQIVSLYEASGAGRQPAVRPGPDHGQVPGHQDVARDEVTSTDSIEVRKLTRAGRAVRAREPGRSRRDRSRNVVPGRAELASLRSSFSAIRWKQE